MVNVCAADLSPSLSVRVTAHVLLPNAFAAGVKLSSPAELTSGFVLNIGRLLHARLNVAVWSGSFGPAEMLLAQLLL
jgi:hypothetical protein